MRLSKRVRELERQVAELVAAQQAAANPVTLHVTSTVDNAEIAAAVQRRLNFGGMVSR